MMYKLINSINTELNGTLTYAVKSVLRIVDNTPIPFDPANTDYANFKREINEGTAQLQDADGNLMTAEQAKDFVKELP